MRRLWVLFLFVALGLALCVPTQAAEYPKVPILMVHGMGGSPSNWSSISTKLRAEGYTDLYTVAITPNWGMCNDNHVAIIDAKILEIVLETGSTQIDVIGHSRGGLNLYDYVRYGDNPQYIRNWVSIAGANNWDCNQAEIIDDTPGNALYTSIYSSTDYLVRPAMAMIEGAHNVEVSGVSHIMFLYNAQVFQLILVALQGGGLNNDEVTPPPPPPSDETFDVVLIGGTWELPIELLPDLMTWLEENGTKVD